MHINFNVAITKIEIIASHLLFDNLMLVLLTTHFLSFIVDGLKSSIKIEFFRESELHFASISFYFLQAA